ncbi:hypothetical protein T484DRAFT_1810805 [Baffinella frigidus]|nr:hypothetical protein T484DRAFT_1810805 [Cryptophyta sp. CCMP2293]
MAAVSEVDEARVDVKVNGAYIKHHTSPSPPGEYCSEVWHVPASVLRRGSNQVHWKYLEDSTTHYWIQSVTLSAKPPPIRPVAMSS